MMIMKRNGENTAPWKTPVETANSSVKELSTKTELSELSYNTDFFHDLPWDAKVSSTYTKHQTTFGIVSL